MLVPILSTNTSRCGSSGPTTVTRQAALKNSSLSTAPQPFFPTEAKALQKPPDGRVAEGLACEVLKKATPFRNGGRRAFLDVSFEELLGRLIYLRGRRVPFSGVRESPGRAILV